MSHINVYVESFTEHVPARMIPVSTMEEIKSAIAQVQATDDLYRDETGALKVSTDWHSAAVLDFGEWLMTHIPSFSEALMCYNFEEFPIIRDWMKYNAVERTSEVSELVGELWQENPPTAAEMAQAHVVADLLLQHGSAMTVNIMADIRGLESVYIPTVSTSMSFEQMAEADIEELENMSAQDDTYWSFLSELMVFVLACVKSSTATLAYTLHGEEGKEAVGLLLFTEGHVMNMPRCYFPEIMNAKTTDEQVLEGNMLALTPKDDFELSCVRMSAAIMFGLHEALTATYEHRVKHSVDVEVDDDKNASIELSIVDTQGIVLGHNLLDEYAALEAPLYDEYDNLVDMFDAAIEVSPFVEEEEATRFLVSACVAAGACELLLTGELEDITEEICDMFQSIDFGLADIALDFDTASIIETHADVAETHKALDLSEEVFEELPEEQRREVFQLLDTIQLDASSMKTIVSLEGSIDIDEEDISSGAVHATALRMPGNHGVPEESFNEMGRLLKQMCIQAFQSPSTAMFVSSRGNRPHQVNLSAVQWKNGHWYDLGEDKAIAYIMTSDIGDQLDIRPGDDIEYRGFRS